MVNARWDGQERLGWLRLAQTCGAHALRHQVAIFGIWNGRPPVAVSGSPSHENEHDLPDQIVWVRKGACSVNTGGTDSRRNETGH